MSNVWLHSPVQIWGMNNFVTFEGVKLAIIFLLFWNKIYNWFKGKMQTSEIEDLNFHICFNSNDFWFNIISFCFSRSFLWNFLNLLFSLFLLVFFPFHSWLIIISWASSLLKKCHLLTCHGVSSDYLYQILHDFLSLGQSDLGTPGLGSYRAGHWFLLLVL